MAENIKTIGVLTSGGDAPGMNAAIRAVVRVGAHHGLKVMGIKRGYSGLIKGDIKEMRPRDVSNTLQRGGTILQTARCPEFKNEEVIQRGVEMAKIFDIEGLVVIGGDGSFRGAAGLCKAGLPTIALPGTIDNDIGCSEYTIGYDTCLNTIKSAVDNIKDTTESHERCSVIEVMGRSAGFLALDVGIACGADVILVPEINWSFTDDVLKPILHSKANGEKRFIVIVAEGVGGVVEMAKKIEEKTGIESRATILGHVQRGGSPSVRDRVTASEMGSLAVELLIAGKQNRIVCMKDNKIIDVDIKEGLAMQKTLSEQHVSLAKKLSYK